MNDFESRTAVIKTPLSSALETVYVEISDHRPGESGFKFNSSLTANESGVTTTSFTVDTILFEVPRKVIIKIDTDGSDFEILLGATQSLSTGNIESILIEADNYVQKSIETHLDIFGLFPDERFNSLDNHSDARRIKLGKTERNRVYSTSPR